MLHLIKKGYTIKKSIQHLEEDMTIKKLLSLGIILSITSSVLIGCAPSKNEACAKEKLKITMIADVGRINDQSFNQHEKVYKKQRKN